MARLKKVLSVLLAIVMLLSATVLSVSAFTYSPTLKSGDIKIILKADKTEVVAGDEVTVSMYVDAGGAYAAGDFGPSQFVLLLNKTDLTFDATSRTFLNELAIPANPTALVNPNMPIAAPTNGMKNAEEKAYYTQAVMMSAAFNVAAGYTNAAGNGWTPASASTPMLSFKVTVNESVKPGDEIWLGFHDNTFVRNMTYLSQAGGRVISSANYDTSEAMVKLTVGSAAASEVALKFADVKNQIRFDKTADGKYAKTFDGRMIVEIKNLEEVLGCKPTSADDTKAIKKIGFLYAKNGAITEAEALTQVKTATAANNYTVTNEAPYSANVTGGGYISTGFTDKANNPVAYAVTGIIHNIPDAEKATPISAAVYAIYDADGDGVDEYTVLVLNGGETFTFGDLYSRNFNTAFPA